MPVEATQARGDVRAVRPRYSVDGLAQLAVESAVLGPRAPQEVQLRWRVAPRCALWSGDTMERECCSMRLQ